MGTQRIEHRVRVRRGEFEAGKLLPAHSGQSAKAVDEAAGVARFDGAIERVRPGVFYRLALLPVALVMLALPLLYLGLIGIVGWATYWHAMSHTGVLDYAPHGRYGWIWRLAVYFGPIFCGGTLVVFLLKPLFARPAQEDFPLTLDRLQEPKLFELIDELCDVVGAPRPARIDVDADANASVRFRRGFLSFFSNDLVLTIGLPLVAGLSQRALIGVIAHELGHFRQGAAMRLTYTVRSINGWFFRAVHERDRCDEWLEDTASEADIRIGIVFQAARLCVWVSRVVIRLFMLLGHAVSCLLARQMEYDADRVEAAVVGSGTLARTSEDLSRLGAATQFATLDLVKNWRACRVPDNFALYIAATAAKLRRNQDAETPRRAGWFDTHPTDLQRITHVERCPTPGVFHGDGPARGLLAHFHMVGCTVSRRYYRDTLGLPIEANHLVSTADAVEDHGQHQRDGAAFARIVGGCASTDRPVFLGGGRIVAPAQPREVAGRVREARSKMESAAAKFNDRFQRDSEARQTLRLIALHEVFIRVGLPDLPVRILSGQYPKEKSRESAAQEAKAALTDLKPSLDAFERVRRVRIVGALQLALLPNICSRIQGGRERTGRIPQMIAVLHRLESAFPTLVELQSDLPTLRLMSDDSISALQSRYPLLTSIARTTVERVRDRLSDLKRELGDEVDPFSSGVPLADRIVSRVSVAPTIIGCAEAVEATLRGYFAANETVVGFLLSLTLDVEAIVFPERQVSTGKPELGRA